MNQRPAETKDAHSRLLKCSLEVEHCRAYWQQRAQGQLPDPTLAFESYWFGAKSLARVRVLLTNFRARYDVIPDALTLLGHWPHMEPDCRKAICHWHLQFADPLYRLFSGTVLSTRRSESRNTITLDAMILWVTSHGPKHWTTSTRVHYARKLMSAAYAAGLLASNRGPRPVVAPRIPDDALAYLMYLLREIDFEGTLLENPYLASVGLKGPQLHDRLRGLPGLALRLQGDLVDFAWHFGSLREWGAALFHTPRDPEIPSPFVEGQS